MKLYELFLDAQDVKIVDFLLELLTYFVLFVLRNHA